MKTDQLLKSRTFMERFRKAALITFDTGHESGFVIWEKGGRRFFGPVIEGGCLEVNLVCEKNIADVDFVEGYLHFHPDADEVISPSGTDLFGFVHIPKEKTIFPILPRKWVIIAKIDRQRKVTFLAIEPTRPVLRTELSDYEIETGCPSYDETQEAVNRLLANLGFKVRIVTLRLKGCC